MKNPSRKLFLEKNPEKSETVINGKNGKKDTPA